MSASPVFLRRFRPSFIHSLAIFKKPFINYVLYKHYFLPTTAFDDLKYILDTNETPSGTSSRQRRTNISKSTSALENASIDASSYSVKHPDICIIPANVRQVQLCVKYCYSNDIAIVPVGARTGLEGGIHPMRGGVSFDMIQMNKILQFNPQDLDCHVQAGLDWRQLNSHIKSNGLWFPVDPGASASLGGMSATSASGTNAVKYGTMRENVIGLEVVIAEGKIVNTHGAQCRSKKSSAGLNLTNLFVGSEGTLGVITSVRLKLHPMPSCMGVALVGFSGVTHAADSVVQIMQCGIPVGRLEFLDQAGVQACYQDSKLSQLCHPGPMLMIEINGLTQRDVEDQAELMKEIVEANESTMFFWTAKLDEMTPIWKARHNMHWSILKTKPGFSAVDTDVCVPISRFPEMIARTQDLINKYHLNAPMMGHAGDGNFHSVILYDASKQEDRNKAKQLAIDMALIAIGLDGTVTGEHGIGRGKMDLIEKQFCKDSLDVMYTVKKALDPKNLFNPDKVFKASYLENF